MTKQENKQDWMQVQIEAEKLIKLISKLEDRNNAVYNFRMRQNGNTFEFPFLEVMKQLVIAATTDPRNGIRA